MDAILYHNVTCVPESQIMNKSNTTVLLNKSYINIIL